MDNQEYSNFTDVRRRDSERFEERLRERRRLWFKDHLTLIYAAVGIVLAALIFIGIRAYNNSNNPMSRFISSSSRLLGTSFSFNITAELNDKAVMSYTGAAAIKPSKQSVVISYDAEYTDYSYSNAIYTDGHTSYKGNYYNGQWTVSDCTDRVQEFFDFYTDYRNGRFDPGSFLRFTGLNSTINADELERFMHIIRNRLSADSEAATLTTTYDGSSASYEYSINLGKALDFIKTDGASVFYSSSDYNRFVERLELNADSIAESSASFSFTVDPSGYMSSLGFRIDAVGDVYSVRCEFSDIGRSEPELSDGFYTAADIEKPTE